MSENAIVVENLSKTYLIGHRFASGRYKNYTALRDVIGRKFSNFARKASDLVRGRQVIQGDEVEEFWALRDVSFEVKQGEVIGIIGRNGAGKSTLLKILSRITEPTQGRVFLSGRTSSLLEVGTGFHPELTGSENIFLNGAILGMTQQEIRRKFDEIVAFAEVEKFLDTPVKHYSSGMYVRLAFAVAAHLEPEILFVDEVLAVGDAEFQKKCLGKIDEVSRGQGRTVLFVSHNMEAVLRLCSRGIFLESGCIRAIGDVKSIIPDYLHNQSSFPTLVDLLNKARPANFTGKVRFAKAAPSDIKSGWSIPFGQQLSLDISILVEASVTQIEMGIGIHSARGFEVASWTNKCSNVQLPIRPGINSFRVEFQHLRLLPGQYRLGLLVGCGSDYDYLREAVQFEIISNLEAAEINAQALGGACVPSATVSTLD
ncbi:MAG TPA: ABC transporter ATP-binding protein [Burkholderiales bacterium]|nr:ABC transporter ATP-binding protein [Burkholderiales bacterium]